jgi:Phage terminase large subunit
MAKKGGWSWLDQTDQRNINIIDRYTPDRSIQLVPIVPSPFQQKIIDCSIDLVLPGGRGGGKTFGKCQSIATKALQYREHYQGLYLRKTFPGVRDFEKISYKVFRSLIPKATYNKSTKTWDFKNGATLELNQLEHESDYDKYQGRSYTEIVIDECGQYDSPVLLDLMLSNIRAPEGIPLSRTLIANPGGVGHSWINKRYLSHPNGEPYVEPETGRQTVTLTSTYLDNPAIDQAAYRQTLISATANDPELQRSYVDGDWNIARGAFFGSVLDKARSLVSTWRSIPGGWTAYLAMDYGTAAPCAIYLLVEALGGDWEGKFYPRGSIVAVDELYLAQERDSSKGLNWTIPEQATAIKSFCSRWGVEPMAAVHVADDACFANDGRSSIAELFLRDGVRWRSANKGSRVSGWEQLRTLMRQAGSVDLPGLYVTDSCPKFWEIVPFMPRSSKNPWDVDTNSNDHIGDAIRYGCLREKAGMGRSGLVIY